VITGGSRGIGRSIAFAFARAGANVVVASRKLDACAATAEEIAASFDVQTLPVSCHVGGWDECTALMESAIATFGSVDLLVNNAGMAPLFGDLSDIDENYYDKVMSVNLKGAFRLSQLAGTHMARTKGGAIINVSSIASIRPAEPELVYATAKAGLNALTVGFADALGPDVRVNAILSGPVETDISAGWDEETRRSATTGTALKRLGAPREIADAACWLASDASSWVTGALIRVDGGLFRQL